MNRIAIVIPEEWSAERSKDFLGRFVPLLPCGFSAVLVTGAKTVQGYPSTDGL
jgi:hypothetical protein